jgi:hypothetical protein
MVVNTLVIGRLVVKAPKAICRISEKIPLNSSTSTITFKAVEVVKGVSNYYSDLQMIGRHFLIRALNNRKLKRHYTIANCMRKEAYEEYVKTIRSASDTGIQEGGFNDSLLTEQDSNLISLSLKNYSAARGLSKFIHNSDTDQEFEIKGPMGSGLDIQSSGTHIAFTAGTGVLVFVDLVAYLIRKNLNLLPGKEGQTIDEQFKFVLYVSFPKREEGIALEICEGL